MPAALIDSLQVGALHLVEGTIELFEQYPRKADDRIQGRAQGMGHVGQELGLDPIQFPKPLYRLPFCSVGTCILNGNADLIGQRLVDDLLVLTEKVPARVFSGRTRTRRLQEQYAQDPLLDPQGECHALARQLLDAKVRPRQTLARHPTGRQVLADGPREVLFSRIPTS